MQQCKIRRHGLKPGQVPGDIKIISPLHIFAAQQGMDLSGQERGQIIGQKRDGKKFIHDLGR